MHNKATLLAPARQQRPARPHLTATHVVRGAVTADVDEIHALVATNAARGLVLPRRKSEIAAALDDYVVVTEAHGRVLACAALQEYSPSLAEVASVVVADDAKGSGLGSIAVRGVEALARRRGVEELFALTLADRFFESLGYERTMLTRYPEKLARYEALALVGVTILPKSCFRKRAAGPA